LSTRNEIRKKILVQRNQLSTEDQTSLSEIICNRVLNFKEFKHCEKVAFYVANKGEVDPGKIIATRQLPLSHFVTAPPTGGSEPIEQLPYEFYLPILDPKKPNHLWFQKYDPKEKLIPNRYGIPEPKLDPNKLINANELDCVLVPLVAFDKNCERLGMGVGYYDRTFSFLQNIKRPHKPLLIGLAYEFQKIEVCEPKEWDIPLDYIVTDTKIFSYHDL